jgi:dihydrofolate reductase
MRTTFVVAAARNGVIGRGGGLPWKLSSDLKLFRHLTLGRPVIMGRRTWESLGIKPLPDRHNIVITRQPDYQAKGALVVHSLAEALVTARRLAVEDGAEEIAIIGGGEIFAEALAAKLVDRIYLSEVDLEPEGDTVMPALDRAEWRETSRRKMPKGPRDEAEFSFVTLDRIVGA